MVRRSRGNNRTRKRRDRGSGGAGLPSRSKSQTDWDEVGKRVDTSYKVLGHPQQVTRPAMEGKHYTVLAYTDWADQFIPTVIKWNHGAIDNLTNLSKSRKNLEKSYQYLAEQKIEAAKKKTVSKPKAQVKSMDEINSFYDEVRRRQDKAPMDTRDTEYQVNNGLLAALRWLQEGRTRQEIQDYYDKVQRIQDKLPANATGTEWNTNNGLLVALQWAKEGEKPPAKTQIRIGDRVYTEHTGAYTAAEAREKAADIRKRGYYARVIKTGSGYTVYAAKKKGGR